MAKLKVLSDLKISRINFLYWVNDRNMTDIAKIIGHSVPVCERYRFKTRREYETWSNLEEPTTVKEVTFETGEAVVFDPEYQATTHPLNKGTVVYFLSYIPNVPGHCIVATSKGQVVPMIHPEDLRKATDEEL